MTVSASSSMPRTLEDIQRVQRNQDQAHAYMRCQHITRTDQGTVHCAQAAVLTPGYYRACPQHVLPMLQRTLDEYLSRPAAAHDAPEHTRHLRVVATLVGEAHKALQARAAKQATPTSSV